MKSPLSPETRDLLARSADAAREVPFDAEALLGQIRAHAAPPPPPAAAAWSKLTALKLGLAVVGLAGLAAVVARPEPRAPASAQVVAAVTPSVVAVAAPAPVAVAVAVAAAAVRRPLPAPEPPRAAPAHPARRAPPAPAPVAVAPAPAVLAAPPSPVVAAPAPPPAARPAPVDPFAQELAILDAAERSLRAGEAREALVSLADLLERNPDGQLVPEAMAAQVRAYCLLGDADRAADVGRRLLGRAPNSVSAHRARASCVADRLAGAPP